MSTRIQRDKEKKQQEKYQATLRRLLLEEDNKYCVDCDAKGPRWASWNLGIFMCIRCAGIHRNLGVHISKVKSVNLDSWTEEQITSVESMGNYHGRKLYEANLPVNYKRPQTDSPLEQFIRAKYEHKKYIDKNYVPKQLVKKAEPEKDKRKERVISLGKIASLQKPPQNPSVSKAPPKPQPAAVTADKFQTPSIAEPLQSTSPPKQRTLTPVKSTSALNDLLTLDTTKSFSSPDLLSLANESNPALVNGNGSQPDLFGVETADTSSGKTSKESILALYGSQASQPAYGVPGGVYIPAQQSQPMGGNFAAQHSGANIPQQNGYNPSNMMGVPNTGMVVPNTGMVVPNTGMVVPNTGMVVPNTGMGVPNTGMGVPNTGMGNPGMNPGYGMNQIHAQQAYLQQVQKQMQHIRVSPVVNDQMGQAMQQQSWNANFNPGMQQAEFQQQGNMGAGFQQQGSMGWNSNTAGHTHSTQLWN